MRNFTNPTLKPLTTIFAVILLFISCKKEGFTVTELGNMAEAKLTEMKTLAADIPCSEQRNISIQEISTGCSTSYYPVKASDLARFGTLKKDYFDLLDKQADAMVKQGVIIDPCFELLWITDQPIRLECSDDKVQLVTPANISIAEARTLVTKTYEEIMTIVNAQTCSNESAWTATALIKDKIMEVEYLPYLRTQDHSLLKKKVSLYNALKFRILQEQGPADYVPSAVKVEKIECVNGKPVVKLTR